MRTRPLVLGLCVAVVAVIGVVVVGHHDSTAVATNGPLYIESGMSYYDVATPGQGVVFSEPPIDNRSNQPVTIDSISLDLASGSTRPMVIQQTAIGLPQRPNGGGTDLGSLSQAQEGPWIPVHGAVIGPAGPASANRLQGYGLIFAVNMTGPGIAWSTAVIVNYHVGSKHYLAKSADLFVFCTNTDNGTDCQSNYQKISGDHT